MSQHWHALARWHDHKSPSFPIPSSSTRFDFLLGETRFEEARTERTASPVPPESLQTEAHHLGRGLPRGPGRPTDWVLVGGLLARDVQEALKCHKETSNVFGVVFFFSNPSTKYTHTACVIIFVAYSRVKLPQTARAKKSLQRNSSLCSMLQRSYN